MKIIAKKVIIIDIQVFLSGVSFKKNALKIADNIEVYITKFATFVFWTDTTNVYL